jgi:hypothetical protein
VTVSVHAVVPSWPVHAFSLLETILYQGFFARFCRLCKLIKTVCIIDFLFPEQCVQWQSVHIFPAGGGCGFNGMLAFQGFFKNRYYGGRKPPLTFMDIDMTWITEPLHKSERL